MVKTGLFVFAIAGASMLTAMPVSFRVVSVKVTASGVFAADPNQPQTAADCARFKLSDKAALRYFAGAHEVDEHKWREELDWTPCSAKGSLKTGDGKTYRWTIDQSGRGLINVSDRVSVFLDGAEFPVSR